MDSYIHPLTTGSPPAASPPRNDVKATAMPLTPSSTSSETEGATTTEGDSDASESEDGTADDEDDADDDKEAAEAPPDLIGIAQAGLHKAEDSLKQAPRPMEQEVEENDDDYYRKVDSIGEDPEMPEIYNDFIHMTNQQYDDMTQDFILDDRDEIIPFDLNGAVTPAEARAPPTTPTTAHVQFHPQLGLDFGATVSPMALHPFHSTTDLSHSRSAKYSGNLTAGYQSDDEETEEDLPSTATKCPKDILLNLPSKHDRRRRRRPGRPPRSARISKPSTPPKGLFTLDKSVAVVMSFANANDLDIRRPKGLLYPRIGPQYLKTTGLMFEPEDQIQMDDLADAPAHELFSDTLDIPDPTLGKDTGLAMNEMIDDLAFHEDTQEHLQPTPFFNLPDFVPADSCVWKDLKITDPTSDQESDDIFDIEDLIELESNSSASDDEARCIKLEDADVVVQSIEGPEEMEDVNVEICTKAKPSSPPLFRKRSQINKSGLALTKPSTRSTEEASSKKRKASATAGSSRRVSTRRRL